MGQDVCHWGQRGLDRFLVALLVSAVLSGTSQAAEQNANGGKIILLSGTQRRDVDLSPKTEIPAAKPLPPSGLKIRPLGEVWHHDFRAVQEVAETRMQCGILDDPDSPPLLEPVPAPIEAAPAPAAAPAAAAAPPPLPAADSVTGTVDQEDDSADNQQTGAKEPQTLPAGSATGLAWLTATEETSVRERPVDFIASTLPPTARQRDFSTLEIVGLSVGISFGLSLLAIWLVVIAIQQFLPKADAFPRNDTSNHDMRQSDSAPVCPNTGPAVLPNRPATTQQRETHVVDLAQDSLALAPITSEYQQRRQEEQQRRNEQQTAILERIYQDNVALQLAPRQPATVQTAPC